MTVAGTASFGFAIAFVAPGAVLLWGLSHFSSDFRNWFGVAAESETTVGGFLFVLLAATALGVFVSGVRWALIDQLVMERFEKTRKPDLDRSQLTNPDTKAAYELANENFYRYYQFYSNMVTALAGAYALWLVDLGLAPWQRPAATVIILAVIASLLLSAKDSLARYYQHLREAMGERETR